MKNLLEGITPPPWNVVNNIHKYEDTIAGADGNRICEVKSFGDGFKDPSEDERKKNSELIAKAPELARSHAELLERLEGLFETAKSIMGECEDFPEIEEIIKKAKELHQ